jgi:hypothetical protein
MQQKSIVYDRFLANLLIPIQTITTKPQIPSGVRTTTTSGPSPGPTKALPETQACIPNSTANVLLWIKKAIDSGPVPYAYLSVARNRDHLDRYDVQEHCHFSIRVFSGCKKRTSGFGGSTICRLNAPRSAARIKRRRS